ncbi:hypothetical protein CBR_g34516 [Chara braunii]|uniref:Uncharacterized protein n=1 Tax=Chara braunii TaxID=69332 RepID=A0A388LJ35_CHABU|nr:hypothetical protein CBR_g34516 [Chara braunii]|eukprot:GBG82232.1 hypothetical protein CBR_g34516 [Chara braunii]
MVGVVSLLSRKGDRVGKPKGKEEAFEQPLLGRWSLPDEENKPSQLTSKSERWMEKGIIQQVDHLWPYGAIGGEFKIKLKQVAEQPANFGNSLPRERREARYEAITTVSYNLLDLDYVIEQLRAAPDGLQKDEEELEEGFIYPMKDKSRKAKSKSRSTRSRASSPSSHCQANLEDITLPEASLNLGGNFAG